jgi:hypothetical protein
MPRRLPSSALDSQTQLTASGTGAVLAANWYIGTSGLGAGAVGAGQVVGTLNGPLTGTADSAKVLTPGKALNGTTFTGSADITVPVNTTSIATSGTYYPTFVPTNVTGNQQASTHASLNYNPNTGYLSATRFVGSGAGLSGVVNSISFNGGAAFSGAVTINQSTYGLSAVEANGSLPNIRLYSSSTAGAVYTFNTSTYTSILRIVVGLGALDAGETALRAVFYTTNPATGQPYGDLDGNGSVGTGDDTVILAITGNANAATSRSNQLLAAIAASADIGLIVRYGWINSSLANDITFLSFNNIAIARSGNTITFNVPHPVAQVQPDWNATTGLGSILNKPTLFDGNYNSLSNKPTIPSVSGTLKEVASWTSGYLGDGLLSYATGGGPIVTGVGGAAGGPLGGWYINIYYEFDPTYFPGYNAAQIAHVHVDYGYPVFWNGYEGGSVFSIAKTNSIVRRNSGSGPVCAVGVTIACNQSRNNGADYWPSTITVHFYVNQ